MSRKIEISKEELEELYISKRFSTCKIAKIYNCHHSTILLKLRIYNIKTRSLSDAEKIYFYNENYFSIPSLENCYWAGFIAADGCIIHRKYQSKSLTIELKFIDKFHLEQFKKYIEFTGPISTITTTRSGKPYYSSKIQIVSSKICNDLLSNFNITPRKSLTLQPPNLTNREQILSYIIGMIDGDGCIHNHGSKLRIQLTGTKQILEWINFQLNNIGIVRHRKECSGNTWKVQYSGQNCRIILKIFKNHIEKYNLPVLNRKWDKVTEEKLMEPFGKNPILFQ